MQALIRWDPLGFAARELADRREVGFPPAVRMASITGTPAAVAEIVDDLVLPGSGELIGPVPVGELERTLVRVARTDGAALASALKTASAGRSARKGIDPARIVLDPLELF